MSVQDILGVIGLALVIAVIFLAPLVLERTLRSSEKEREKEGVNDPENC